jgi:lipopolysaccharide/colanic/teichoic acid biosynthesis glycosyltransferase
MPSVPNIPPGRRHGAWPAVKRSIDVVGAATALVLLSPLMAVVAVAVRLDSRGPAFFRQERLGREGRPFRVVKFRSMHVGVSDAPHRSYIARAAAGDDAADEIKKLAVDARVTRVGRLLRAASVDELPQLVNVLRGDMSLVGPRPALGYELEHYAPRHFERFLVRPGLTGLWQVSGRSRLGFSDMLDLDVEYARCAGLRTDLVILAKTPAALIGRTA